MVVDIRDAEEDDAGSGSVVLGGSHGWIFRDMPYTIVEVHDSGQLPNGAVVVELCLPRELNDLAAFLCTMAVEVVDHMPVDTCKITTYEITFGRKKHVVGMAATCQNQPVSIWGLAVVQSMLNDLDVQLDDLAAATAIIDEAGAPKSPLKALFMYLVKIETNQAVNFRRSPSCLAALLPGLPRDKDAMEVKSGMQLLVMRVHCVLVHFWSALVVCVLFVFSVCLIRIEDCAESNEQPQSVPPPTILAAHVQ